MKKVIAIGLAVVLLSGCSNDSESSASIKSSKSSFDKANTSYVAPIKTLSERAEERIANVISDYADKCLIVVNDKSDFGINVIMNCYDPYVFAQIAKACSEEAKKIVSEEEIEEYFLIVSTPSKNSQNLFWYSTDLNSGLLTDNNGSQKYERKLTVDEIVERYASEEFDGTTSSGDAELKVFIASSGDGKRYHRKRSCSGMNGNAISISVEQAKARGYSPCKICY